MAFGKTFGEIIKARRNELGLVQDDVAKIAGVTKTTISDIENGKNQDLKAETLFGLAKALKWTAEEIKIAFYGKPPKNSPKAPLDPAIEEGITLILAGVPDETLQRLLLKRLERGGVNECKG